MNILTYYLEDLYNEFDFTDVYKHQVLPEFSLASNISFIIYKVQEKECDFSQLAAPIVASSINLNKCYYPEVDSNNINTTFKDLTFFLDDFTQLNQFNETDESLFSNIYSPYVGYLNAKSNKANISKNSDSVLFALDLMRMIPISPNFQSHSTNTAFKNPDNNINNYILLNQSTRAVQVIFTMLNSNLNQYYSVNINFYFLATGVIIPGDIVIQPATFSIYEISSSQVASDVVRFICIAVLLLLCIFPIIGSLIVSFSLLSNDIIFFIGISNISLFSS